jgi:hypothetical protein
MAETRVLVLDFDCTITSSHLHNIFRVSGRHRQQYLAHLTATEVASWDSVSLQCLQRLREGSLLVTEDSMVSWNRGPVESYNLCDAKSLFLSLLGGPDRLRYLHDFLAQMEEFGILVHVSTYGYLGVVIDFLESFNLLHFFTLAHGFDDEYTNMILKTVSCRSTMRPTWYEDKQDFLLELLQPNTLVVYADDTDDDYKEVAAAGVLCLVSPTLHYEGSGLQPAHLSALSTLVTSTPPTHVLLYPDLSTPGRFFILVPYPSGGAFFTITPGHSGPSNLTLRVSGAEPLQRREERDPWIYQTTAGRWFLVLVTHCPTELETMAFSVNGVDYIAQTEELLNHRSIAVHIHQLFKDIRLHFFGAVLTDLETMEGFGVSPSFVEDMLYPTMASLCHTFEQDLAGMGLIIETCPTVSRQWQRLVEIMVNHVGTTHRYHLHLLLSSHGGAPLPLTTA